MGVIDYSSKEGKKTYSGLINVFGSSNNYGYSYSSEVINYSALGLDFVPSRIITWTNFSDYIGSASSTGIATNGVPRQSGGQLLQVENFTSTSAEIYTSSYYKQANAYFSFTLGYILIE